MSTLKVGEIKHENFTGTTQLKLDNSGRLLLGTTTEGEDTGNDLTIANSGDCGITIRSGTSSKAKLLFSDGTSGDAEYRGNIQYDHNGDYMKFSTAASEHMRMDSSGTLLIGATSYGGGGTAPALYVSNTGGRQVKIHNTNANTTSIQLTNATSGEGEDGGMMFATLGNSADGWINNAENAAIRFGTNGTERMRILAGGGLTFNGDTAAANGLDDYEEGTFTPEYNSGNAASACMAINPTYSAQVGVYRKIGNMVFFQIKIEASSATAKSGQLQINGLPFTSGNFNSNTTAGGAVISLTGAFSNTAHMPTVFISGSSTSLKFFQTNASNWAGTDLNSVTGTIHLTGQYPTS